jgi:hypothetical protein
MSGGRWLNKRRRRRNPPNCRSSVEQQYVFKTLKTPNSVVFSFRLGKGLLSQDFIRFVIHYSLFPKSGVVTNEKIGGSGVTSTLGTWYGGVVIGVLLSFNEAAILYRDFNSAPSQKQNIIVFAANNSRCCGCHVAPTIVL